MSAAAQIDAPLGSGAIVDEQGMAVVTDLTPMDLLVISCLQDVEDHPDLILDAS